MSSNGDRDALVERAGDSTTISPSLGKYIVMASQYRFPPPDGADRGTAPRREDDDPRADALSPNAPENVEPRFRTTKRVLGLAAALTAC